MVAGHPLCQRFTRHTKFNNQISCLVFMQKADLLIPWESSVSIFCKQGSVWIDWTFLLREITQQDRCCSSAALLLKKWSCSSLSEPLETRSWTLGKNFISCSLKTSLLPFMELNFSWWKRIFKTKQKRLFFILQDIPSVGIDKWFDLEGRSARSNVEGQIRLHLRLATREDRGIPEEDNWTDIKQHEDLMSIFIEHEIKKFRVRHRVRWGVFSIYLALKRVWKESLTVATNKTLKLKMLFAKNLNDLELLSCCVEKQKSKGWAFFQRQFLDPTLVSVTWQ